MEYLVAFVVLSLISAALAPKPPAQKAPALADIDAPTADEGRPIPVVFGTVWITGPNVIWYGDLRTTPIVKKAKK